MRTRSQTSGRCWMSLSSRESGVRAKGRKSAEHARSLKWHRAARLENLANQRWISKASADFIFPFAPREDFRRDERLRQGCRSAGLRPRQDPLCLRLETISAGTDHVRCRKIFAGFLHDNLSTGTEDSASLLTTPDIRSGRVLQPPVKSPFIRHHFSPNLLTADAVPV